MTKQEFGRKGDSLQSVNFISLLCVLFFCGCLPLLANSQFTSSFGGGFNTPQSPCPRTFQYQSNGYEVYGAGQILPGQYEIGGDIFMMANLIIGTQLPSVSVASRNTCWGKELGSNGALIPGFFASRITLERSDLREPRNRLWIKCIATSPSSSRLSFPLKIHCRPSHR